MRLLVIEINGLLPKSLEHAGLAGSSDKWASRHYYKFYRIVWLWRLITPRYPPTDS